MGMDFRFTLFGVLLGLVAGLGVGAKIAQSLDASKDAAIAGLTLAVDALRKQVVSLGGKPEA